MSNNNHKFTCHNATISDVPALVENKILFGLEISAPQPLNAIHSLRDQMISYCIKSIT